MIVKTIVRNAILTIAKLVMEMPVLTVILAEHVTLAKLATVAKAIVLHVTLVIFA